MDMRLMRRWLPGLLVVAVVVAVVAAVDESDPEVTAGTGGSPEPTVPTVMDCGGYRFPAETLLNAPEPADAAHPAVEVMRTLLSDTAGRASFEATEVDASQVRVLDALEGHALLGIGDPTTPGFVQGPPVFLVVRMEPAGDSWSPADWSGCDLRIGADSPPGESPVVWYPTGAVSPDATSIPIAVLDQACASGRTAEERVREPVIEYRFDLPTGLHQISVAADGGPSGVGQDGLEEFFEVTGPTWLVLRYSADGGEGSLTFSAHDEPPAEMGT